MYYVFGTRTNQVILEIRLEGWSLFLQYDYEKHTDISKLCNLMKDRNIRAKLYQMVKSRTGYITGSCVTYYHRLNISHKITCQDHFAFETIHNAHESV